MPTQPKSKGSRRSDGASSSAAANDPRFASMATDPRFRLPSARHSRVGVDKRFSRMFKDDDFSKKATVDRYGRKVAKGNAKKELERFYKIEDEDGEKKSKTERKARDVVGSDEESDEGEDAEEDEVEVADDSEVEEELKRLDTVRDPARQGGFSSSEDESSSDEESDEEVDVEDLVEFPAEQQTEVPMGEVSSRLAVVNLDWDNIRASDLLAVAQSFAPGSARISQVVVYPSEFGRERMEKEELEGPPREIFASSAQLGDDDEEDSDEEEARIKKQLLKEDEGEEFDSAKLRQYQLDRLKYYYAVITCDSKETAKILYESMDGREYLSTANFFDLRFIPDEVSFEEDTPRDDCTKLPPGYKPNEFVTDALTHSKVKLTWDADDTTRKEVQKRAFSRAEIDENDLQAYIGSDSSDDDDEDDKAAAQRQKMRAALGLSSESAIKSSKSSKSKADGPVGDMQITFTSGLTSGQKGNGVFENEPILDETTREKYIRKEKERKARRKEKMKAARTGTALDDDDEEEAEEEAATAKTEEKTEEEKEEDDPFNDPFFNDTAASQKAEKQARKADRMKRRSEREAKEKATAAQRAELELLMVDDKDDKMRHFDMNAIAKAEKQAKKKNKNKKKKGDVEGAGAAVEGQEFVMETQDPRFKKLFESHEFAIDPTNPRFKGTSGMKALLEEGRKKRSRGDDVEGDDVAPVEKKRDKKARIEEKEVSSGGGSDDLQKLLARVKAKNKGR